MLRRLVLLAAFALAACGGADADDPGARDDDFTQGDFPADQVLPYKDGWLDAPHALAGVGQFDRLKTTKHDDAKCSTMVAMAAAVVGGEDHFVRFLDAVAKKREGRADDLAIIDRARTAVAEKKLTSRHLQEFTEVVVRAYGVENGAYDGQISEMVRASGYQPVKIGSSKPADLVAALAPNEVVPLSIMSPEEDGSSVLIPHITLIWMDARGVVRLYDSDDFHGSHVMARGSAPFNDRMTRPDSSWDLREKYR